MKKLLAAIKTFDDYNNLDQRIKQKGEFKKDIEHFGQYIVKFAGLLEQFNVFAKTKIGFEPTFSDQDLADLARVVSESKKQLTKQEIRSENLMTLYRLSENMALNLTNAWEKYAESKSEEVIHSLELFSPLFTKPERAKQIQNQLKLLLAMWPISERNLLLFESQLKEALALIDALDVNSEVRDFINLVNGKKATVADLNATVLDWLKSKHFESKFKVGYMI